MLTLEIVSIKGRICVLAGLCMATIVATLIAVSLYLTRLSTELVNSTTSFTLKNDALLYLSEASKSEAQRTEAFFRSTVTLGESIARQLDQNRQAQKAWGIAESEVRQSANTSLKLHASSTNVFGMALALEQNQALDNLFVDKPFAGNETGRFSIYQSKQTASYTVPEKEIVDDGSSATLWYNCPIKQRRTCITNPYSYTDASGAKTLMATIAVPLLSDAKAVGTLSIDISLASLQDHAVQSAEKLYGGVARVMLVSPDGLVAADSRSTNSLGKPTAEIDGDLGKLMEKVSAGETSLVAEISDDMVAVSSFPGTEGGQWITIISVPQDTVITPLKQLTLSLESIRTQSTRTQLWIALLVVLGGLGLIAWLGHSISQPIKRVATMLGDIASGDGDLTKRLKHSRADEVGALVDGFNRFLNKLQPIISAVTRSVTDTRVTADQAANIAAAGSAGMLQQFREIEQVATASQEMTATSHDVAQNAAHAASAAANVEAAARDGLGAVQNTAAAIGQLASHIDQTMTDVAGLAESSEKIGGVLEVIRSIAEQTNLLALNAAIEAARAGESGRGFAVVADEVRHLARRTQDSVSEIRLVVELLQNDTRAVVQAMEHSHSQAAGSVEQVKQTTLALERINEAVEVISEMNLQIASAAEEQSAVSEEVSKTVLAIRDVTKELADHSERSAKIGADLNTLANEQQQLMSGFKS
nr:methyl-accepting chemotaxis protein [Pseudomonas akapageensis]